MANWKDDILAIVSKSLIWIEAHQKRFLASKKSKAEFYQMYLFQNNKSSNNISKKLLTFYSPIDEKSVEQFYYRKLEYYALLKLQDVPNLDDAIETLFKSGFLYQLLLKTVPLDILASKDHLYAITHDIFYSSIFGKETTIFETSDFKKTHLLTILEQAILLTIRKDDVDIFMELVACLLILNLSDNLSLPFQELCSFYMKKAQRQDGSFGTHTHVSQENSFENCYHTTLVAGIIFFILGGQYDVEPI